MRAGWGRHGAHCAACGNCAAEAGKGERLNAWETWTCSDAAVPSHADGQERAGTDCEDAEAMPEGAGTKAWNALETSRRPQGKPDGTDADVGSAGNARKCVSGLPFTEWGGVRRCPGRDLAIQQSGALQYLPSGAGKEADIMAIILIQGLKKRSVQLSAKEKVCPAVRSSCPHGPLFRSLRAD